MDFGFIIPFLFVLFFIIIPALKNSNSTSKKSPPRQSGGSSASDNFRAQIEAARQEMQRRGISTTKNPSGNSNPNTASQNTDRGSSSSMSTRRSRDDARARKSASLRAMAQRARKHSGLDQDGDIDPRPTASNRDRQRTGNKGRDDWGTRGDSGLSSGKAFMIYALLGFLALFIISQVAPDLLKF